jgi:hypothetical protein
VLDHPHPDRLSAVVSHFVRRSFVEGWKGCRRAGRKAVAGEKLGRYARLPGKQSATVEDMTLSGRAA